MQCDEFEIRFKHLLDERRAPELDAPGDVPEDRDALREHARRCFRCRRLAAAYVAMLDGIEQTRPVADMDENEGDANDGLSRRVLAALEPAGTLRFARRRRLAVLAAAAAVLLAVVGPRQWFGRNGAGQRAQVLSATPAEGLAPPAADAPRDAARPPRSLPAAPDENAAPPYRLLARETTASLSVAMQLLPLGPYASSGTEPRQRGSGSLTPDSHLKSGADAADAAPGWVRDLSGGLTPVTAPTAGVFSTFMELLAGNQEETRS